jgi:hypothetical protein
MRRRLRFLGGYFSCRRPDGDVTAILFAAALAVDDLDSQCVRTGQVLIDND